MDYHVVDVFAERPYTGNPLTVFPHAGELDDATMGRIANETNHSETTFVTSNQNGTAATRIFTPQTELPFAGHPTLGTAYVTGATTLDLSVGHIPIERQGDLLWMKQKPATFASLSPTMMQSCLGVPVEAATVASTGTPVALVEVRDSDAVRKASLRMERYQGPDVAVAYVFSQNGDHDIHARSFGEFVGIREDAATGGAAGPLIAWLAERGRSEAVISQGIEMGRPSQLHVRFDDAAHVGGKVQTVAKGTWLA